MAEREEDVRMGGRAPWLLGDRRPWWHTAQSSADSAPGSTQRSMYTLRRRIAGGVSFYRAMHFSANARSWDRMSSVRPSVSNVGDL